MRQLSTDGQTSLAHAVSSTASHIERSSPSGFHPTIRQFVLITTAFSARRRSKAVQSATPVQQLCLSVRCVSVCLSVCLSCILVCYQTASFAMILSDFKLILAIVFFTGRMRAAHIHWYLLGGDFHVFRSCGPTCCTEDRLPRAKFHPYRCTCGRVGRKN